MGRRYGKVRGERLKSEEGTTLCQRCTHQRKRSPSSKKREGNESVRNWKIMLKYSI
jgi:hypothetical protein